MSKNTDRYKDSHLEVLSEDELLELETASFEKFSPKKKDQKSKSKKQPKEFEKDS